MTPPAPTTAEGAPSTTASAAPSARAFTHVRVRELAAGVQPTADTILTGSDLPACGPRPA